MGKLIINGDTVSEAANMARNVEYNPEEGSVISLQQAMDKLYYDNEKTKENLTTFHYRKVDGKRQVSDDGVNWENFSNGAELLWTNPAPNSDFSAQKINIDLTEYEWVLIQYKDWNGATVLLGTVLNKGTTGYVLFNNELSNITSNLLRYREITEISNSGIAFNSGKQNSGTFDSIILPQKIYGLKKLD